MPVLTEIDLLRDLLTAHRIRIAELELQRDSACRALLDAERVLRDVLDGCGASLDERLRASVGLGNVLRILRTQPQPVAEPVRRYAPRLMVVKP